MKSKTLRMWSAVLVLALMLSLSGCGGLINSNAMRDITYASAPNTTVTSDSKWINSAILGAVDSTLTVSEKDDFFTAINLDWELEQKMPEDAYVLNESAFATKNDLIHDRKMEILTGKAGTDSNIPELTTEELTHTTELVMQYAAAASDWDARNAQGMEPLRRYLDGIESIQTLDEMTAWLTDPEGANFTGECFFTTINSSAIEAGMNMLVIMPDTERAILGESNYKKYSASKSRSLLEEQIHSMLEPLGYSAEQVDGMLTRCYALEGRLVDHNDYEGSFEYEKAYTMADLVKLCGAFPIQQLLDCYGLGRLEEYHIGGLGFMKDLGRMYTQANLDDMKAYLTIHLTLAAVNYLDRDTFETFQVKTGGMVAADDPKAELNRPDEEEILLQYFVGQDMSVPLQILYIANYCTYEEKVKVKELISDILDSFREILVTEEWMSEDGKLRAEEKLDALRVRALYPDTIDSYLGLVFEEDDDLMTMAQKARAYEKRLAAAMANTPVNTEGWDIRTMDTTVINAYYAPTENSINILAGYLATESNSIMDQTYEALLAGLGTVIGHEVTHGFDTLGINYDKDGGRNLLLGATDASQFDLTARDLKNYFGTFPIWPGGTTLKGDTVSGEAIADMGGMRIALNMAEKTENFDYDLFFRTYAANWREMSSFNLVNMYAGDEHPPVYLRTNATLQQFEKFYEVYDIQPGDGMYLAPENRVAVW